MEPRIEIPHERIAAFCEKWRIVELALFGSVLREDFGPDSDVDVLVTFAEGARPDYEGYLAAEDELRSIFGRDVDMVQLKVVVKSRNYIRRHHILTTARRIYVR